MRLAALCSFLSLAALGQTPKTAYLLVIGIEFPKTVSTSTVADRREFPPTVTAVQTDAYGTRRVFNATFRNRLFGSATSVADYFSKISKGNVVVASAGVYGPYAADEPADHYWEDRAGKGTCEHGWSDAHRERRALAIERFIAEEIDLRKNFSLAAFDNDKNGRVDKQELIVAVVAPQTVTDGYARGAQRQEGSEAPWKVGKLDWDLWGSDDAVVEVFTADMLKPVDVGLTAHEVAHILIGAGDEYENKKTLPQTNPPGWDPTAPGPFSLMDQHHGHPYLDPFQRYKAGWLTPKPVLKDGYYPIEAVESGGPAYKLADPKSHQGEYFLVENRQRAGYDIHLPDDGVAIWHVDESRLPDYRTAVEIEPASGPRYPIDYAQYLWEGFTREFWTSTTLTSSWHDGSDSGIGVRAISKSGDWMRAYFDVPGPGLLVQALPVKNVVTRGDKADFLVRLVNTGSNKDTFELSIVDPPAGQYSMGQNVFTLDSYQSIDAPVSINVGKCATAASIGARGASLTNTAVATVDSASADAVVPSVAVAPDAYESNNSPAAAKTLNLQQDLPLKVDQLSLHTPSDVDYFALQFQPDKPGQCSAGMTKLPPSSGPGWQVQYLPSTLHIAAKDEYCRPLQVSVSGSGGGIWQSTTLEAGFTSECPEMLFPDSKILVAVRSPDGQTGRYSIEAAYSPGAISLKKVMPRVGKPPKMPPAWHAFGEEQFRDFDELARTADRGFPAYNRSRGKIEFAEIQHALGRAALQDGNFREASERLRRSAILFQDLGLRESQADVARSRAELASAMKDDAAAVKLFEQASSLHAQAGDEEGRALDLMALARHYAMRRDARAAFRAFDEALERQSLPGDRALNLLAQAEALAELRSFEGAVACAQLAAGWSDQGMPPQVRDEVAARTKQLKATIGADFHKIGDRIEDARSARRKAIFELTGR